MSYANLVEDVTRKKIFESKYWLTKLYYANANTIIDLAVELKYFGGSYGSLAHPSDFLCLLLKLLSIKPDFDVIKMFLETDFRYLQLLGAFYIRLTQKPRDVYVLLEPFLDDYRRLVFKQKDGSFTRIHMDECIEQLLTERQFCNVQLPSMISRGKLEQAQLLPPRQSKLQEEFVELMKKQQDEDGADDVDKKKKKKKKKDKKKDKKRSRSKSKE